MTTKIVHSNFNEKYMLTKDMAWLWLHKEKINSNIKNDFLLHLLYFSIIKTSYYIQQEESYVRKNYGCQWETNFRGIKSDYERC